MNKPDFLKILELKIELGLKWFKGLNMPDLKAIYMVSQVQSDNMIVFKIMSL